MSISNSDEMWGYIDGLNGCCPPPGAGASYSYRHGFAAGRCDLHRLYFLPAQIMRCLSQASAELDRQGAAPGSVCCWDGVQFELPYSVN